jgi:hypothetical protein
MKNNTEVDYRNAIKAKYEVEKSGDFHGFLDNPSPAQLRELCLLKFDNGLNKIDEGIFRIYYKVNETDNLRDAIYNYHIPKFKTIQSFLAEENKKTNIQNLNLMAVLVDFNPRPFNKFTKGSSEEYVNDAKNDGKVVAETAKEIAGPETINPLYTGTPLGVPLAKPKRNLRKNATIGLIISIIVFSVCYTAKGFIFPKKECMEWKDNHYELVDCKSGQLGIHRNAIPYDPVEFNRKKLDVCNTTPFFKNHKPIVWYSKQDNTVEFFNMDGNHPVTDCELKQITQYMIDKYVPPCK